MDTRGAVSVNLSTFPLGIYSPYELNRLPGMLVPRLLSVFVFPALRWAGQVQPSFVFLLFLWDHA
jgi:hypothetical protein